MEYIRYLSIQEIIAINVAVNQRYSPGGHIGVKDGTLLWAESPLPKCKQVNSFHRTRHLHTVKWLSI